MEFFLQISFYLLLALTTLVFFAICQHYTYWQRRNVVYKKAKSMFLSDTMSLREPANDMYEKFKGKELFGGLYLGFRKAVVILDLDLIKQVLITDFNYFTDRDTYHNEKDDPISAHLFNLHGSKWRKLRAKLTPTFTSGKMKFMFPCVVEVGQRFVQVLQQLTKNGASNCDEDLEIGELLSRFTTDVIGSCAFGLECNSLNDPNTEFRIMGRKAFTTLRHGPLVVSFAKAFPNLARRLGIALSHPDVANFMMNVVRQTVEYRERENIQKNDFINLLIELKNNNGSSNFQLEQIAAQSLLFFLAGFLTSSSTMGFALYEMALNQNLQQKARQEIHDTLKKHNNELTYEGLNELKYLHQILCETMRKYSVVSALRRRAVNDYKVPNTCHTIKKGMGIFIPVDAIHHDPNIYPNPSEFKPERFTPDEIAKRHSMSWLPFGEGPRNCIGLRFGMMQAKIGLALIIKHFQFELSPKTAQPLQFNDRFMLLTVKGGIHLKLKSCKP